MQLQGILQKALRAYTAMKKLDKIFKAAKTIDFDKNSRFIIMSDCHRGQGNTGDNYLPNKILHFAALEYYYKKGFSYIELGDGDELWENRRMCPILTAHSEIFETLNKFNADGRLYMLYGNHDITKRQKSFRQAACQEVRHDICVAKKRLFPDTDITEGLVLRDSETDKRIFLVHGHQCSTLNSTLWPIARFLVRYLWKPLELIGFCAPTDAASNHKEKEKLEKKLSEYAFARDMIVIAGHTHRPMFPKPGSGRYFNDGSCVHPGAITGIEIVNGRISLIQWSVLTKEDMTLYARRKILRGAIPVSAFYDDINR